VIHPERCLNDLDLDRQNDPASAVDFFHDDSCIVNVLPTIRSSLATKGKMLGLD
jgi:hypothetical protein